MEINFLQEILLPNLINGMLHPLSILFGIFITVIISRFLVSKLILNPFEKICIMSGDTKREARYKTNIFRYMINIISSLKQKD